MNFTSQQKRFKSIQTLFHFKDTNKLSDQSLCSDRNHFLLVVKRFDSPARSLARTDVPDVRVGAHLCWSFLELQAAERRGQLAAAVRMPRETADRPLHRVRISASRQTREQRHRRAVLTLLTGQTESRWILRKSDVIGQMVLIGC